MGYDRTMRTGLLFTLALWTLAACQPRPRRPVDGGDATIEDEDDAEASVDSGANADASVDRASAPDVVFDEEGGLQAGPQTPPQGRAALVPWLQEGDYRRWDCQRNAHVAPAPSAHAQTRICFNTAWINTLPSQIFPVGAAAVKELYNPALTEIVGYAVMLKVGAGNNPADWYWFQRVPAGTVNPMLPEPIEPDGTVADRVGSGGNALRLCASCHSTAGEAGTRGHHYAFTLDGSEY
jgi:hypothetical protein